MPHCAASCKANSTALRRCAGVGRGIFPKALSLAVVAFGLTAIYILPILESAPESGGYQFRKEIWSHQQHGARGLQSLARIITDLFPITSGQRWNLPGVRDVPLDSAAVGSIVLALSIYALVRSRRAETWFFAGLAVFGIAARSAWTPLASSCWWPWAPCSWSCSNSM